MRMTRKRHRQQERKRLSQSKMNNLLHHLKSWTAATALVAFLSTGETFAMPQDGAVTAGNAAITQNGNAMTVQQMTDKVAINWQSFNIGANEKVAFHQPNAQSVALNRIIGNNASTIYGQLTANGKVFLVNANGILFAPGSEVNVGGLVATTHSLSDTDFMKGNYTFTGQNEPGAVINQGSLTARDGGYVVLLGNQVKNSGTITASGGTAALAVGGQVFLDAPGDGVVNLVVNQSAANASIQNSGMIQADGGKVLLTGQAGGDLLFSVINNSGIVSAKSVHAKNGVIILDGGINGTVEVSGTLDASGQQTGQQGGTVKVLGEAIKLHDGTAITASGAAGGGEVLIGGNWQGQGVEAHASCVFMEKGAVIEANALQQGDGGKVVLWSDEDTRFHGTITARGGVAGGSGGKVETSGKNFLAADGSVNVAAPNGQGGTWLLDPRNIIIQQGSGDTIGGSGYDAASDNAVVNVDSINSALNIGGNVVITTGSSGTQDGNITVAADIAKSTTGEAALTLSAANNIIVKENVDITATNGKLHVNLDADRDGQYSGMIQMQQGSSIVTNGGNITMYGQGDAVNGYARSATTASQGIQLQGTTLNAGGGNITLRGENTATVNGVLKGDAISVTGSNNQLLTSGSGVITMVGKAGDKGIAITDTAAQFSAGSGRIVLTADRMALAGKIGGQSSDTGTLALQPFSNTASIGVGGGAGTLQLDDDVFNSVIQSSLSKVTVGRSDLAATIDIGAVAFRNNMNFLAGGVIPATGVSGKINITGDVTNTGKTITLNSVQGTSTTQKLSAGSLELLGEQASYSLTHTGNVVGTLAAHTGSLTYQGGALTIGTAGATDGLSLTGTGSIATGTNNLTVAKNVTAGGDLAFAGKNITLNSGAGITTSHDAITLTGTGTTVIGGVIDSHGGAITVTGTDANFNNGSVITSDGGAIQLAHTGAVQLKGTSISSSGGSVTIAGNSLGSSNSNSIHAGTGVMTFSANSMALPVNTLTVTGTGIANVQALSAGRVIDLGDGFANDSSHLQLAGQLFGTGGAFSSHDFSRLNIGRSDGTGAVNIGDGLTFRAATAIRTGDSGSVNLTSTAEIDNTTTNQALMIEAGTINSSAGAKLTSGSGLLTLSANAMNVNTGSTISTANGGSLLIRSKTASKSVGLGTAAGDMQLADPVFANVLKPGFADITVQGSNVSAGALTSVHDNLTLQSTSGAIQLSGDLAVANGKTITLQAATGANQTAGTITADGLQLLGTGAVYTLEQSGNTVGKLAADTGSVSFKGQQVTVDSVANAAHGLVTGITAAGNVKLESAAGTTLTQNASVVSTGGDITLTADAMKLNSGKLQGYGKLQLQPLTPSRAIDLGAFSVNPAHLQLAGNWFDGGTIGIQAGFHSVVIGRDNGAGMVTVAGTLNFANPTTIQSPIASGSIELQSSAHLTAAKDLWLTAGTITAEAGSQVVGSRDITLTADAMNLGTGNDEGSTITGSGGTLTLRPLEKSVYVDLGTGLIPEANHLQFSDALFTGSHKVFSGFSQYTIGGNVTDTVTVAGTAHFDGHLELQSPTLQLAAHSQLDPAGNVTLRNNKMIFDDYATVTGTGDLTLTPYTAGTSMVVGTLANAPASALTIDRGAFTGGGRTGGAVFTGTYNGTLTFGDASVAKDITLKDMIIDDSVPSASFSDLKHLQILAQADGTAAVDGTILAIDQNITIQAGTINTGTGTAITSSNGDITLIGHALNLNSGTNTVQGSHNLYLKPYYANDSIAIGDASLAADLRLPQTLFYNTAAGSNGALGNGFSHITIGRADGSGTIQIKGASFQNDLTVLSPGGSIQLAGNLNDSGRNITLEAAGITQANGSITASGLELLGGAVSLDQANQIDSLAAHVDTLNFRNAKSFTVDTVNQTVGVTTTGNANLATAAVLTVNQAVNSTGGGNISLEGAALAINPDVRITTGQAGDITLTGNTMTIGSGVKVIGEDQLQIQTLDAHKNIGFGGNADSSLELAADWFNPGSNQVFQDGFDMITIGHDHGTGTVTVDQPVTFSDAVTLQAPDSGGKVVLGAAGRIDHSLTDQNITLKGSTVLTETGSQLDGGSGTVTLQGDVMNFNSGSTITGRGDLVVKPLLGSTAITVGRTIAGQPVSGSGLILEASAFNGNDFNSVAIKNNFDRILIGSQAQGGAVTVNDFAVGTDLHLLSQATGGTVTVDGTLSTTGQELTVAAHSDIHGMSGILNDVGKLNAVSNSGVIDFSNTGNTIHQLGPVTAAKSITIVNNQALTLTDEIKGNTAGTAGTANSVLIRAKGDLTLDSGAAVSTQGGADIYLAAEGKGSQFFNHSAKGAKALDAGGRWLIYSHSPLSTKADYEPAGSEASNIYGGLTSDFRRYNVTYESASPANTMLVPTGQNGFLYEYQPILTVDKASRTYGDGNTTIQFTYNGLLAGDTIEGLLLRGAPKIDYGTNASITETSAAGTQYWGTENPYLLNFTEDSVLESGDHTSLYSLQGYKIVTTKDIPLTINKRSLTVTPGNVTKVYNGHIDTMPTYGYSGTLVTGDSLFVDLTGGYTSTPDAGTYTIAATPTISGNPGDNYLITANTGAYTITKAPLTVTVGNQTKVYSDANPTAPVPHVEGFVNGETAEDLFGLGYYTSPTASHTAAWNSTVGDYAINASGGSAKNYTFTYTPGKLTITPKAITVTANNNSKVYGNSDPALTYSTSANLDGLVALKGSLSREAGEDVKSGGYKIMQGTLTYSNNPNYTISFVDGTFTITPRNLTVIADNKSRVYGDTGNPEFTFTTETKAGEGLVLGDQVAGVTFATDLELNQTSQAGSTAAITPYDAVFTNPGKANNYHITYQNGTLTVDKAKLTVTVANQSKTYGDANPVATYAVTGFKNNETESTAAGYIAPTASHTAGQYSAVKDGGYAILTNEQGAATNYTFEYVNGTLTIDPRHITVISDPNQTKVYGQNNPGIYTYTTANMVNGDVLSGKMERTAGENAGTYDFNLGTLSNPNYIIDSLSGPGFTVTPATLTVVADAANKVYGTYDPAQFTYQATGFVKNTSLGIDDSAALLTGELGRNAGENAGQYAITQNTLGAGNNYTIAYTGNTFSITPAQLIIQANAAGKTYGDDDPALTYQTSGLVKKDDLGINDLDGLTGTLSREAGENSGVYQINQGTVDLKTAQLKNNYQITYQDNTLTIDKADLTITANDASRLYGDANPAFTASYSGLKRGDSANVVSDLQLTTSADVNSHVGSYAIVASNGLAKNYNLHYVDGKLTITPATLTYVADPRERTVGTANPSFSGFITGFKNQDTLGNATQGTAIFTSPATEASPAGRYAINGSGLTANFGNYIFVQDPGNATALTIKGLNPPGQDAVDNTHGYHPTPPTTPGSTIGGGSTVNIGFNGNGAVTVGLGSDANDVGDLTPRKEGISLPVFTRNGGSVSPEGLYDVSYNQTSLTVLPSGQNVPPPPAITSSDTPYAPFDLKIGDGTVSFSVQAVNGVVVVTPLTDEARQVLQKNDKDTNKLILAHALLTAVNELTVMPDQLLAVILAAE